MSALLNCLNLRLDFSEYFLTEEDECHIEIESPYPFHKPFKDSDDVIQEYHTILVNYYKKFYMVKKNLKESSIEQMLEQNLSRPSIKISNQVLDLYNQEKVDVPYICNYNPFYITGCLDYLSLNDIKYLIRPQENQIILNDIDDPKKKLSLKIDPPITERIVGLQIVPVSYFDAFLLIILQNEVQILEIDDIGYVARQKWRKKFKKRVLFAKYSNTTKLIGVILLNNNFYMYDTETNQRFYLGDADTKHVLRFDMIEHQLVLQHSESLEIINLQSLSERQTFEPKLNKLDSILNFKVLGNLLYVVTKYALLRVDMEDLEEEYDHCSHLMKTEPLYLDYIENSGIGYLCLLSQKGECVLFIGYPVVSTLPRSVPEISETLTECRLTRDLLLIHGLEKRLKRSFSGIKLVWEHNHVGLYTLNDLGEIFKQQIVCNGKITYENELERPVNILNKWIKKLPEVPTPELRVTNITDAAHLKFLMNKKIFRYEVNRFTRPNKQAALFLKSQARKYHTKNLQTLAQSFAAIWEDDDEEDDDEVKDVIDVVVPKVPTFDKVSDWIQSHEF